VRVIGGSPPRRSTRAIRRQSFVLIEVLIAFGLVVSSGLLFLQSQMNRVKAYRVLLRDIAMQNAYQEAVVRCVEAMCLQEIPMELILENGSYDIALEGREEKAHCTFSAVQNKDQGSDKAVRVEVRFFVESKTGMTLESEEGEGYRFCLENK